MFALVSYQDGAPMVLAGPCWPFCVFITLPLILVIPAYVSSCCKVKSMILTVLQSRCLLSDFER